MAGTITERIRVSKPYMVAREIKRMLASRNGEDAARRMVSIEPPGPSRGRVLMSYKNDAFFLEPDDPALRFHTNVWESGQIAKTFCDMGYGVDVIDENDRGFRPERPYTFFLHNGNGDKIVGRLNEDCVRILHIDSAHWLFHSAAQMRRLLDLQERRGVTLSPRKAAGEANRAIELADCCTMLGNDFTEGTFRYAGRPIFRVPISTPVTYDWPERKDFAASSRSFVWFGGRGLAHKGLDLVLEAFASMPEYRLTVCGPISQEKDFEKAFHRELYETANIRTVGWVDIASPEFVDIADNAIGAVYASCSEGQCGSVVTCMHAGLVPIVSYESGVDVHDFGFVLRTSSVAEIREAVERLSVLGAGEIRERARKAWEFAQQNHTREKFAEEYRAALDKIVAMSLSGAFERVPGRLSLRAT